MNRTFKSAMMALMLVGLVACSASNEVESSGESDPGLSGIDATTQRAREQQAEAEARAARYEADVRALTRLKRALD